MVLSTTERSGDLVALARLKTIMLSKDIGGDPTPCTEVGGLLKLLDKQLAERAAVGAIFVRGGADREALGYMGLMRPEPEGWRAPGDASRHACAARSGRCEGSPVRAGQRAENGYAPHRFTAIRVTAADSTRRSARRLSR